MRLFVATDTGGTFTDLASFDAKTGCVTYSKCLTDDVNLVDGVAESVRVAGINVSDFAMMKHGTTQVINALIQRAGSRTALITTAGFKDIVEIGRGNRPVPFALNYRRNPPLVSREYRFEVAERLDSSGQVVEPLDTEGLSDIIARLREMDIQSVAISFVNSYLNPVHEDAAAEIIRRELPGVFVTTGTSLSREWFEYERVSTAIANAYVSARMAPYSRRLEDRLKDDGFRGVFYLMGSNGGALSVPKSIETPIALVESGPIGGCIGAAAYAKAAKKDKIIAFDMGGTTAKCALIVDGKFEIQPTYYLSGYEYGFPLRTPVIDIIEVGAGGGSIAKVDAQKRLTVGPQSAGSNPGPVAFGRGGQDATVTDANLALGRISSEAFLQGGLDLDAAKAKKVIESDIATPLGHIGDHGVDTAALGILDVAAQSMAGAIKEITIERGHDIRSFSLMVFGGSGPLFGSILARRLGIPEIIIPLQPGNFSTLGMLFSDARSDLSRSFLQRLSDEALQKAETLFDEMGLVAAEESAVFTDAGELQLSHYLDMRYEGQTHTILVPYERGQTKREVYAKFSEVYKENYGRIIEGAICEILGARMTASRKLPGPNFQQLANLGLSDVEKAPTTREVCYPAPFGRMATPIWKRDSLKVGDVINGPAIIEEYSSTTVLLPDDKATVCELGEIVIKY